MLLLWRNVVLWALLLITACHTHDAVLVPSTDKEHAWATKQTTLFGLTLSQKLFYCYADVAKRAQPVCVEAEFVEKEP